MTDYDFIDPDLPEKRTENNSLEDIEIATDEAEPIDIEEQYPDVDSDKVGGENNVEDNRGFLGRAINKVRSAF
jgi:hypothetical protein